MNKNHLILLLSLLCLASLSFGFYQKLRADQQEALAMQNASLAERAMQRAEVQKAEAQRAIQQARLNEMITTEHLNKVMKELEKKAK